MQRWCESFRWGALLLLVAFEARAYEFVPLQQRAQGRSLTGAVLLNDSLFSNPASSAFTSVYSLDGTYLFNGAFAASVLDTKTSPIGGGLAYYRLPARPGQSEPVQGGRLGLSARVAEHLGVGILGKMAWGPDVSGAENQMTDLDAGLFAHFSRVQVGLSTHNLLGGNAAMGVGRSYALGARINWQETMFFSASVMGNLWDISADELGFGAEYVSPYYFSLKGGFRLITASGASYVSGGFSILSPRVSVHYAVEAPNQGGGGLQHGLGATFLF